MDYTLYKNAIMIPDQSAWQQLAFTLVQSNPIDVFGFFDKQQIKAYIPFEAKKELGYQSYNLELFSGNSCNIDIAEVCVFSNSNGSLTSRGLQPNGFDVVVVESSSFNSETINNQSAIWDSTSMMKKILKHSSLVDYYNVLLARYFQSLGKKVFVFTNDQLQIKQLKFESILYMRPDKLFLWMCKDGHINPVKCGWNHKKRKMHDNRWTKN